MSEPTTFGLVVKDVTDEIPQDAGVVEEDSYPVATRHLEAYISQGAAEVVAALGTNQLEGVGLEQARTAVIAYAVMRALEKMAIGGATLKTYTDRWDDKLKTFRGRPETVSGVSGRPHRSTVPAAQRKSEGAPNYGRRFGPDYQW